MLLKQGEKIPHTLEETQRRWGEAAFTIKSPGTESQPPPTGLPRFLRDTYPRMS